MADMRSFVDKWNNIIYPRDDKGDFRNKTIAGQALWERWNIRTYPVHKHECYSRCPYLWAEDIDWMMSEMRRRFGDSIRIIQLKEKWCELTVYFEGEPKEGMNDLIDETAERLIAKGLHPTIEELKEVYAPLA